MSQLFIPPFAPAFTILGQQAPAAKMAFYESGTTTLATVYDADGDPISQAPNTYGTVGVAADITGRFPPIYLGDEPTYKVVLRTAQGTQIGDEIDPYENFPASSEDITFIQGGDAAEPRTVQGKLREHYSNTDNLADPSATNLTQSIQDSIDYFGYGGVVELPYGGLTGPIFNDKAVKLLGRGMGSTTKKTQDGKDVGWLKASGAAGQDLITIVNTFGGGVENIRLIGDSANRPASAINVTQDLSYTPLNTQFFSRLSQIWIGEYYGLDTDSAKQFECGIVYGPTGGINNDTNLLEFIRIANYTDAGFDFRSANASDTHINVANLQNGAIGIRTFAGLNISTLFAGVMTDVMFELMQAGSIVGTDIKSEKCARLLRVSGDVTSLVILGGGFQCEDGWLPDDGGGEAHVIDTGNFNSFNVDLQDYNFQVFQPLTGPIPVIKAFRSIAAVGSLRMMNTQGIWPENFDIGESIAQNLPNRGVIYFPRAASGQDPMPRDMQTLDYDVVADRVYRAFRNDNLGELNVRGGPLNVQKRIQPVAAAATATTGTGATAHNYKWSGITYDGGETPLSALATCLNAATLDSTHKNTVTSNCVPGCYGGKLYKDTGGGNYQLLATVTWAESHSLRNASNSFLTFIDDGSVAPSGAAPTSNTTGNAYLAGALAQGAADNLTAHAGGTQAAALQLEGGLARVTTVANIADSVRLPPAKAGRTFRLRNSGANSMQVYGYRSETINGAATATGVAQAAGTETTYACFTDGAWFG